MDDVYKCVLNSLAIEKEWVTFRVQRPAKNVKIERKRETTTKTLTRDWVTSGHIYQTTEKHCGVSVSAHLLDRDACVPPTVGIYGASACLISTPVPSRPCLTPVSQALKFWLLP